LNTTIAGIIAQQTITRSIFDYTFQDGSDQGSHTLYVKKYNKSFQKIAKSFSAATVETSQMGLNQFITLEEGIASTQTGIVYTEPTKVSYSDAEVEVVRC